MSSQCCLPHSAQDTHDCFLQVEKATYLTWYLGTLGQPYRRTSLLDVSVALVKLLFSSSSKCGGTDNSLTTNRPTVPADHT